MEWRPMIELQRSRAGGRRALSGVFRVMKEWGKGRSFVEQDKASAVQCRRSSVFSNTLTTFPPLHSIGSGQRHSAAKSTFEEVIPTVHSKSFRHPGRPVSVLLGPVIAV